MINGMRPAPIRMMGLSSGMDTDMIIQQMMRVHQFRIDQRSRQRTMIQWRKETHNSIADEIRNFQRQFLSLTESATTLRHSSAFVATRANVTAGSPQLRNAVTISTLAGSTTGSIQINHVASLARNAAIQSSTRVSHAAGGMNPAHSLQDIRFAGNQTIDFGTAHASFTLSDEDVRLERRVDNGVTHHYLDGERLNFNTAYLTPNAGGSFTVTRVENNNTAAGQPSHTFEISLNRDDDSDVVAVLGDNIYDRDANGNIRTNAQGQNIVLGREVRFFANDAARIAWEQSNDDPDNQPIQHGRITDFNTAVVNRGGNEHMLHEVAGRFYVDGDFTAAGRHFVNYDPIQFSINGRNVELTAHMTVNQMIAAFNTAGAGGDADTGFTLRFDRLADRFILESRTVNGQLNIQQHGGGAPLDPTSNEARTLALFGLGSFEGNDNHAAISRTEQSDAQLAWVYIDRQGWVSSATNTFDHLGLRITLNAVTTPINLKSELVNDEIQRMMNSTNPADLDFITPLVEAEIARLREERVESILAARVDYHATPLVGDEIDRLRAEAVLARVRVLVRPEFDQYVEDGGTSTIDEFIFNPDNATIVNPHFLAAEAAQTTADTPAVLTARADQALANMRALIRADGALMNAERANAASIEEADYAINSVHVEAIARENVSNMAVVREQAARNVINDELGVSPPPPTAAEGGPLIVNVERDTEQLFNRIVAMVEAYNAFIGRVEGLLRERQTAAQRAYRPLLPDEMRDMSERDIERWNEVARHGHIRGDHGLTNLTNTLREDLLRRVRDAGLSPQAIGLRTGSFFDGTGGQIIINETDLRNAIQNDPDAVQAIFTSNPGGEMPRSGLASERGWLHVMNERMTDFLRTNGTSQQTIRNLERAYERHNEQINTMMDRMWREEERLFRQFAAMESALTRLHNQGDWMQAMMSAWN